MTAIIYHDADFDGKLSNKVCRYWLERGGHKVHSYGWDYGKPLPEPPNGWSDYNTIYIVDLSVDELMQDPKIALRIAWIDHHKTAIKEYEDETFFYKYCIDGVAACRLCWQWFTTGDDRPTLDDYRYRSVVEPTLIRLVGEYDVWDKRDPDAEALQYGLRSLSNSDFDCFVSDCFDRPSSEIALRDLVRQGYALKDYCDKQNAKYAKDHAHTIKWEGLTWCALNIGQRGNSRLFDGGIKSYHDACFAWRWTGDSVLVSLYHIAGHERHDLSAIASRYGGGGHKGACGFRITLENLVAILT